MTGGSCFVHSQRFSYATGVNDVCFPRGVLMKQGSCLFFSRGFLMPQGSCYVLSKRFSYVTGFMFCSHPEVFS